jgi:hypothetical protein
MFALNFRLPFVSCLLLILAWPSQTTAQNSRRAVWDAIRAKTRQLSPNGVSASSNSQFAAPAVDLTLQTKLTANDGAVDDLFGTVALDGDTAVIGASGCGDFGCARGAVYVYARSGETWALQQKLLAADGVIGDGFGYAVAISGNTLIASSPEHNSARGAAYVFIRNGTSWTQQAKLTASNGTAFDNFGDSVALNGDAVVVGATKIANQQPGEAYFYTRAGTVWTQQQRFTPAGVTGTDQFTFSAALSGDTLALGSPLENNATALLGSIYVFTRNGNTWTLQQRLASSSPSDLALGFAVALDGNSLIGGAPAGLVGTAAERGAAAVYTRNGTTWTLQTRLTAIDGEADDHLGTSVAIQGNTAVVGAPDKDFSGVLSQGAAYNYTRSGSTWGPPQQLAATDGAANDFYGEYAAVSGTTAIVSSRGSNIGNNMNQGAAYIYAGPNAGAPQISINDISVTESNAGTVSASFSVTLSTASTQSVVVNFATANGTATAGSDYVATTGSLTFAPGELNKLLTVTVNGDTQFEPNETFFVNLSGVSGGAVIADGQGQATIFNDDQGLQFGPATYIVNEGARSVIVSVTRLGVNEAAAVDIKTNDNLAFADCATVSGQANQRCDYISRSSTLTFAPGSIGRSVEILITDDFYAEGNETITLTLSNPVGASIVGTDTATITVQDNDAGTPTTNPIDDARFFTRQHYNDFLARLSDQAGEDFWTGEITQCGADAACVNGRRIGVSAAFFVELEFQESGAFVYRLYKAAYGEQTLYRPSYAQFQPDRSQVVGGASLEAGKLAYANLFAQRAEFTARYPLSQTPAQFVDAILATVQAGAGVTFNATQRQNFINDVTANGRGLMLKNLGDNAAFKASVFNRAFVLTQYFGYLRRDPDQGGYDFWLNTLNANPANQRGMVCAFITSQEYQQRFSQAFTRTNALCGGNP